MTHSERGHAPQPGMYIALAFAFVMASCCIFKGVTAYEDMTPKQKAVWMMSVYNAQYADYQAKAAHPETLTEDQVRILRVKKDALKVAWPLIKTFNVLVDTGAPSGVVESRALEAVMAILEIAGGG